MAPVFATLDDVKIYAAVLVADDDALLNNLILLASRAISGYISRTSLFLTSYSETYDGVGNTRLFVNEWPVISISSLNIGKQNILPAPAPPNEGSGYRLQAFTGAPPGSLQPIDVYGTAFYRGRQNILVNYKAGYSVQNEPQTIPGTPYVIIVNQPYGIWAQDDGVVSASGTVFTAVASSPAQGQYSVDPSTGSYTFNSADTGTAMLISYSYIPADIQQACIEMVTERYRFKERIGMKSKSLGGQETASYDVGMFSKNVMNLLQPYKRVAVR